MSGNFFLKHGVIIKIRIRILYMYCMGVRVATIRAPRAHALLHGPDVWPRLNGSILSKYALQHTIEACV